MRVLFLNPPFEFKVSRDSRWPEYTKSGTLYYPYWLAYATGVLIEKTEHEAMLIDAIANGWNFKRTIKEIKRFDPDLVVIETTTPTILNDMRFAEILKAKLNPKICFVGTHVSVLVKETFERCDAIDFIARGEFDYTIKDLADSLEGKFPLKKVLGLSYRKGKRVVNNPDRPLITNLDELPFVSKVYKRFLDIRKYRYALARHPMVQIWSSRGCIYRCTFCVYPQTFSTRIYRTRSPENFVDELEWIKENLPVKEIFIEDDTFTIDKKRVVKICKLIRERKLDIVWSCNARADIPYDVLKEMKRAGCRMLIVGYESGVQEILDNVKKGIRITQAKKFTLNAKKLGLRIFGCFMVGLPGETRETVKQTLEYAKELNPDMGFFQQAVPFPGTVFYEWCKAKGYLVARDWGDWLDSNGRLACIVNYPNLSNEEICRLRNELMVKFYLSPKWLAQAFLHNLHPDEMVRMLNAVKDYLKFLLFHR